MKNFRHSTFGVFAVFCFLSCAIPLHAHLHGVVVDDNGDILIGANVYWAGTTIGTATDENGMFEIEPIRQTKLLVTSYLGFHNDTTLVTDKSLIKVVLVNNSELDEVTITQRKMSVMRSRFSAFDVQTIGGEELCRAACCNLSESFETNASVDVAYADAATGMKQIRMLGLSGTYVQLLGENCPAVRGLAQSFGLEYIPGPWMQSIQISKGTSSVINGYEAITGQINVEYLKPQLQDPIAVNVMLNTDLNAEVNLTGGWDIPIPKDPLMGTLSTGLLAHYRNGAWGMDDNRDGFLDMPRNQNLNLLNRWYYKNDEYTFQFLVRGLHDARQGGQRLSNHPKLDLSSLSHPYLINLNTDRIEGFMKNGIILDEESGMSIGIITAASYHRQNNDYGARHWYADQWNAYLNAIFQNTWDDHKLSAGLSLNYDRYTESFADPGAEASRQNMCLDRQELTPGFFAEYTYSLAQTLSVIAGLRGDWSSRYGWFATPRLNVRYAPFEWWTIRASVGLGYRSPNMLADNARIMPSSRQIMTLSTFDAQEQSINAGLTMVYDIPVGTRNLQLSAEYYHTRFFNELVCDLDRNPGAVFFYNLKDIPDARSFSHTAQLEATMEILRGWTLTAAFRYTDVKQTTWCQDRYILRDKVFANRFKGVITTSYQTPLKTWQFDFTAQFNGPSRLPDGLTKYCSSEHTALSTWYPQLLAQVTKYFKYNVALYVGAENMTNFRQDDPVLGVRNEQGLVDCSKPFDAGMVWGPTTGWKVYMGLRWSLDRPDL